jgi:hypothetical protein
MLTPAAEAGQEDEMTHYSNIDMEDSPQPSIQTPPASLFAHRIKS